MREAPVPLEQKPGGLFDSGAGNNTTSCPSVLILRPRQCASAACFERHTGRRPLCQKRDQRFTSRAPVGYLLQAADQVLLHVLMVWQIDPAQTLESVN